MAAPDLCLECLPSLEKEEADDQQEGQGNTYNMMLNVKTAAF